MEVEKVPGLRPGSILGQTRDLPPLQFRSHVFPSLYIAIHGIVLCGFIESAE
jgi:hypothetical protein